MLLNANVAIVGFIPTLDYPFEVTEELVKTGNLIHRLNERAHDREGHVAQRRLMATDEHGRVGEVNAQDIQQVSLKIYSTYLHSLTSRF